MSKREWVRNVLDNKETDKIPVGFWHHFIEDPDRADMSPENFEANLTGHQKFYDAFKPDFLKLMSDGFFQYPDDVILNLRSAGDLNKVKASAQGEWIDKQVELTKKLTDKFGSDVLAFYNVFSPMTFLRFRLEKGGSQFTLQQLFDENPEGLSHALNEIAKDVAILSKRVITEGKADGIYFSTQSTYLPNVSAEQYKKYISPSEFAVLEAANSCSDYNMLHICGYYGAKNELSFYADYPVKAVNWAVTTEHVSLKDGKELFGGKAVIGGFANTKDSLLYKGSKADIEQFTEELLKDAGKLGVIVGADCTVPADIDLERLQWVREKAAAL